MSDLYLGIIIGAVGMYLSIRVIIVFEDWYSYYRIKRIEKEKAKGVYV